MPARALRVEIACSTVSSRLESATSFTIFAFHDDYQIICAEKVGEGQNAE